MEDISLVRCSGCGMQVTPRDAQHHRCTEMDSAIYRETYRDGGGPGLYGAGPPPLPPPNKEVWKQTFPSTPFGSVLAEMQAMHDRKNADYGRTGDPLSNVRASTDFGVPAWVGAMIRANDKMRRIQKFAADGALVNESVEDSLLDLTVYAVIGLILYREQARG